MKLKILFLSTSLGLGGADKEVIKLGFNLVKRGHEVKLISMTALGIMGLEAQSQGLDVTSLNMPRGIPNISVIPKFINIVKDWKPLIIHSHMFHANIFARLIKLLSNVPVLLCTAQNIDESHGKIWRNVAYRISDFNCNITTNVSQAGIERYIKMGLISRNKARFIPNSINISEFYHSPELRNKTRQELSVANQFIWLAVGRFSEQKDYPNMIKAFSLAVDKMPEALLLIAGQGKLRTKVESIVKSFSLESNIKFLGPRRDILALMNAADGYLMSSAWEGMPLVLLEAAATQLPIVATDVGGIRETLLDGESGFLAPPQNSEALAIAMQKLMKMSDKERLEMGKRGREYIVSKYSTEKIIKKWENLYFELLENTNYNIL